MCQVHFAVHEPLWKHREWSSECRRKILVLLFDIVFVHLDLIACLSICSQDKLPYTEYQIPEWNFLFILCGEPRSVTPQPLQEPNLFQNLSCSPFWSFVITIAILTLKCNLLYPGSPEFSSPFHLYWACINLPGRPPLPPGGVAQNTHLGCW